MPLSAASSSSSSWRCITAAGIDKGASRTQLLLHENTILSQYSVNLKRFSYAWIGCIQLVGKSEFSGWTCGKQHIHLIRAVATVEPKCLVTSENGYICEPHIQLGSSSDSQVIQPLNDDILEMDERERLRRIKISKANKGNVPWNKGRKHSAETIRKICERTKIAMQDPKVKMKLVNLGHAQSEETRAKIRVGVRDGWQRRRKRLIVQESCFTKWQNIIAEASRKGYAGEDELQWDSYKILDEQLKREWLESVEDRKTMPRQKGNKRAPKSLEQRRKISEAISAKWADPEYRNRVHNGLAKYHGIPVEAERKARSKPTGDSTSVNITTDKKAYDQLKDINNEAKSNKKAVPKKRRNATPYKDPMASSKLEMIKKIRAERAAIETKRREATEKAKLLIAEAEKAAKVLEVAALKSPLAQASLLETRNLIAEATRSIASIENGLLSSQPQDARDKSFYSSGSLNSSLTSRRTPQRDELLDRRLVNGSPNPSSSDSDYKHFGFDKLTLQNAEVAEETGSMHDVSSSIDLQVYQSKINGYIIGYDHRLPKNEENATLEAKDGETSAASATKTKKWVRGRLVEGEEEA